MSSTITTSEPPLGLIADINRLRSRGVTRDVLAALAREAICHRTDDPLPADLEAAIQGQARTWDLGWGRTSSLARVIRRMAVMLHETSDRERAACLAVRMPVLDLRAWWAQDTTAADKNLVERLDLSFLPASDVARCGPVIGGRVVRGSVGGGGLPCRHHWVAEWAHAVVVAGQDVVGWLVTKAADEEAEGLWCDGDPGCMA